MTSRGTLDSNPRDEDHHGEPKFDVTKAAPIVTVEGAESDAPTVTPEAIESSIRSIHYFTAYEGVMGERFHHEGVDDMDTGEGPIPDELKLMTVCVLVLDNGFTILGTSACASPERYNKEIGQNIARKNAVDQVWTLLGYKLRTQLHEAEVEVA